LQASGDGEDESLHTPASKFNIDENSNPEIWLGEAGKVGKAKACPFYIPANELGHK
jgi:hypothetical protein